MMRHVLYHFLYRQIILLLACNEEDKLVHGKEFKREGGDSLHSRGWASRRL